MTPVFDASAPESRDAGVDAAVEAISSGGCIVLPTDTVYGIGADAFDALAVEKLLSAKGRGRAMPPPVLIPSRMAVDGLGMNVPSYAKRLMDAFWPGALTIVVRSQPSLAWDLGETNGTVALRIPDDEVALAVLRRTGPLAVSSANRHGEPAATTINEAGFAFGPTVEVYLDAGPRRGGEPSTIVDCTKADPVILRYGAIAPERLREVLAGVELVEPAGGSDALNGDDPNGDGPDLTKRPAGDDLPHEQAPDDYVPEDYPADEQVHDASEAAPAIPSIGAHWTYETTRNTDSAEQTTNPDQR